MAANKKISSKKVKSSRSKSTRNKESQDHCSFPIVAIGASAGGLEAFEKVFSHLTQIGMAYIVITHLDREHASILPELIKKYTSLSVVLIKNGAVVAPDTIYVIPPKSNVEIKHGILHLVEQSEPHYANFPINLFFRSLAEDKGENAIAIILSGSGSDGSLGLRDIKEHGGLTIAQDPLTAGFDNMPRNAIHTGYIDYVMPAEEIPHQLTRYLNYGKIKEGKISPELEQIFIILRTRTGHDFSHYKLNTVCRRIEKQMYAHHIQVLADYVRFLRLNLHEVDNLFKDLLIGVTRFFRDPEAFNVLKNDIFPLFLKKKPKDYYIRVWVPACSTGEEAYSIAIILQECMDEIKKYFNIQIFGTDIDLKALEIARNGIYPESISADIDALRLKKFFIKDRNRYKINKAIRSMVIFGEQNIIKDPPFTKLDLICCRNLLIYLSMPLQKKLLPLFHYSLKPKGILFLGTSEATAGFTDHFQLLTKKWKIFERKENISSPPTLGSLTSVSRIYDTTILPHLEQKSVDDKLSLIISIQKILLDHYVSPSIVVNKSGEIIYTHGNTDPYLLISKKKTNLNIFDHVFPQIKIALLPSIRRVELQKKEVYCKNLIIQLAKNTTTINLRVMPITHVEALRDLTLIIFEEIIPVKSTKLLYNKSSMKKTDLKLEGIVQELRFTKENLQATIEELESGNEELQSTNEELQSTNEEIETSKEELQSLNEELVIVNTELQSMIDQLASVNDDMNNLFNSTEIAAFFLDNDLRIKRFTPKAQEFIHLIKTDIGRSISHFSTTIKYDKLVENAEEVIKTLHQKNIEVESYDNHWYHIRILPYRTLSNMIDGVVITLTDITVFKEYEQKLKKLNEALQDALTYSENIVNTVREPLLILNTNLKIISANTSFYNTFNLVESDTVGKSLYDLAGKKWDVPKLRQLLDKVILDNEFFDGFKMELNLPKMGICNLILNGRKIFNRKSESEMILLAMEYNDAGKAS